MLAGAESAETWDFFISHASEDKEEIALPLTREFERAGFKVWFDQFTLRLGENVRARLDEGLARSRFGIVIASPSYFAKKWASAELSALFALEEPEVRRIIPIWHGLDAAAVATRSPLLAARSAISTQSGLSIPGIASAIVQQLGSDLCKPTTLAGRLLECVAQSSLRPTRAFLQRHLEVLFQAVRLPSYGDYIAHCRSEADESRADHSPDFVLELADENPSALGFGQFAVVTLGPTVLANNRTRLDIARNAVAATERCVETWSTRGGGAGAFGIVVVGRRRDVTTADVEALRGQQVRVRTYDWLVDTFIHFTPPKRNRKVTVLRIL